jgi:hypothetical protein
VWCTFPGESHNGDGRHTAYLQSHAYRQLDPELYEKLRELVNDDRRSLRAVETAGLFASDTIYYGDVATGVLGRGSLSLRRKAYRDRWLVRALAAAATADLVFLDPDNGIATKSTPRFGSKGGKYVFWDEVERFWRQGQSLVVYHHLNRTAPAAAQTAVLRAQFQKNLGDLPLLVPLLLRRGSCRYFWVVGQQLHADALEGGIERFAERGWHQHFEFVARDNTRLS